MKIVVCIIAAAIMMVGCDPTPSPKYPQNSSNEAVQFDDDDDGYEVEKCDWDDHPNEPECRGSKKHKKWLQEQRSKQSYNKRPYAPQAIKPIGKTGNVYIAKSSKSSQRSRK